MISLLPRYEDSEHHVKATLQHFYERDYDDLNPSWHCEDGNSKVRDLMRVLPRDLKPERILEVGCGAGFVLNGLCEGLDAELALGVDISRTALLRARGHSGRAILIQADAEYLPFRTNSLDLAVSADILEHTPAPHRALREQARVGRFLLAKIPIEESAYTWAQEAFNIQRRAHLRAKFGHIHHFTRGQALKLVNQNGFRILTKTSSMIPNRKGILRPLQDWTYRYLGILYPLLWGGFTVLFAVSKVQSENNVKRTSECVAY